MSADKRVALGLPQLDVRFLVTATAGMWMEECRTAQGRCSREL